MKELVITAANSITSVGHDGRMTSACVRAGLSRLYRYETYLDEEDNPITVARITGIHDDNQSADTRLSALACQCLEELLSGYFQHDGQRPSHTELLLGAATKERPGPRYEHSCRGELRAIMEQSMESPVLRFIPQGNASLHFALQQAGALLERDPGAICIVGGVDSLLRESTLNWFEQQGRLKSESYGRHQGLMAGEAVGFLIIEAPLRAERAKRPVLARVVGLGLAQEPAPRASNSPSRNSGLTEACRHALGNERERNIRAVLGDLNGENGRAREWSMVGMRCFEAPSEHRKLWSPAGCYGDIGAASGTVLATIATQGFARGWLPSPILLFCSDDHGPCGALVLEKDDSRQGSAAGDGAESQQAEHWCQAYETTRQEIGQGVRRGKFDCFRERPGDVEYQQWGHQRERSGRLPDPHG
jgi:3-oxoacyl-[acyl-carrier-protein] synthase I